MHQITRLTLAAIAAAALALSSANIALAGSYNHSGPSAATQSLAEPDTFAPPTLGTIPLPESKVVRFPYDPANPESGVSTVVVNFPDEVRTGEPFSISATFLTQPPPGPDPSWDIDWNWIMLLMQLYMPAGVDPPTEWIEDSVSPWAPEDDVNSNGQISQPPSIDWLKANWWSWDDVAVAPFLDGRLIVASEQNWGGMGHYVWAWDGDAVTWTFSSFTITEPGDYVFELVPEGIVGTGHTSVGSGWYWDVNNGLHHFEPISFTVHAVPRTVPATVDIKPDTFNRKAAGRWLTAYVEVPGYDLTLVDVASIRLNGAEPAPAEPTEIGDHDLDGMPDLMVKFGRASLTGLPAGAATIRVTGTIGQYDFAGEDAIRVL